MKPSSQTIVRIWDAQTSYSPNDYVFSNGLIFRARMINTGEEPIYPSKFNSAWSIAIMDGKIKFKLQWEPADIKPILKSMGIERRL